MELIIVGGFSEVFELCKESGQKIVGYIDKKDLKIEYKYLGSDEEREYLLKRYKQFGLVISPDEPAIRECLAKKYWYSGASFPAIISPKAKISTSAEIGKGAVIQFGVFVSTNTSIGSFVKLNTYANIMHDVNISEYTTVAPNAAVMGRVSIGKKCYIGANSTIKEDLTITSNVIIGAGAVVVKDIRDAGVYVGVPAVRIK